MSGTFISPENTWALWTVLAVSAALAIYLEQTYSWANKVTGCILALFFTLVLANLSIIPTDAPTYDAVWSYVVPLAVPMLLFRADVKKIGRESGRMIGIYLISGLGTILGAFVSFYLLRNYIPNLAKMVPMFVGTYTGGSVNLVAMADYYQVQDATSAAVVADNLLMAIYFFILIALPSIKFLLKKFKHPYIDAFLEETQGQSGKTQASQYWDAKAISLKDLAMVVASSFLIVTLSTEIAGLFSKWIPSGTDVNFFINLISGLLGNKYLIMTTLTMVCATVFSDFFGNLPGSQEVGTFLIYLFFAVIGAPASLSMILTQAPLLLVFTLVIILFNLFVSLGLGKLFGFSLEEIIIASNANVGGPTTAAAMAIAKGWDALVIPALLVGTLGYVIGNYYGIFVGTLLQ